MSSISGISGASSAMNPYLTQLAGIVQSNFAQTITDYQAVGTALQSGDISKAKAAMASFQKDLPAGAQSAVSQFFGKNSQASNDFQSLVSALKADNLTAAQKAFSALQTDLKTGSTGGSDFSATLNSLLSGLKPGS
jgi:hypothetical protein